MLACYVSSLFLRRPPLDPPAVINHPGRERPGGEFPPGREEKEKPKERPDALTMVSHFVKRNIRREQAELLCYCAHGTVASHLVYDSDSKNQYLERGLLMT